MSRPEPRQVTATIASASSSYAYDGLGQRVRKTVGGVTTTYVYDAFGNMAAEYGTADASPCGTATCYVTVDYLGSTRLLTDATGSMNVRRYDYQPFGAEIPAGYGGRTTAMGYVVPPPDSFGPKFTGQQRDSESGLDWFNVRHMSGAQGRFQSPDPANAGAAIGDPQTWNAYAYVGNNPLSYTDPSGQGPELGLCAVSPIACGIGAAIGLGIGLWDLFGGGHHTPSLANFPFPNQFPSVSPSGGSLGSGANDEPWNEQLPAGVQFGRGLNVGGVFGSGNTGPFVFSFEDRNASDGVLQWANQPWVYKTLNVVGTFSAGAADFITFGITKRINDWDGGSASINYNSGTYTAGKVVGVGLTVGLAAGGGATAAAIADGKSGAYFGRGTTALFNSGKLRFGWGWKGTATGGRDVIRLGIGPPRGTSWWNHIILWYPKAP